MKSRSEKVNEISTRVLLEIIFNEKKNFNTKEYGDDNYPRTIPSKEEGIYVGQENIELWRRLWSSPQWPGEM